MGDYVVSPIRRAAWPQVITHATKIHGGDLGVMVTPLTFDQLNTGVGVQVDHGIGQVRQDTRRAW